MPRRRTRRKPRCLIVERHAWETGFAKEQIQIPLAIANRFFGTGVRSRKIRVRLADAPSFICDCSVSKTYKNRTRRVNGLPFLGLLGSCFVFFQELDQPDEYEVWCEYDLPVVAARFRGWHQAQPSQHGRGRLATIVAAPVEHPIRAIR